jgi:hypothetical protein
MRAFLFVGFLALTACVRTPTPTPPESNEIVFDDTGPFIRSGNEKRIDYVYAEGQPETLLVISWTTVSDFVDQTHAPPQPDSFSLFLVASGHITLLRQTVMRTVPEWTRYYPPAETENLFDSLIPTIEQFSLDLRARPENYVVRFRYQTKEGPRTHDCLLANLTPITSLLISLRLGGAAHPPEGHFGIQGWARTRFNIFPPEQ